uniref:Uncharacterized protein n=1 Tax=Marmota marmota marmota TaxID=9994 RepID=A0A8C6EN58_MARMA
MPLEEKPRAIETQKKRMESLSAWQHLKLGKATFLHKPGLGFFFKDEQKAED